MLCPYLRQWMPHFYMMVFLQNLDPFHWYSNCEWFFSANWVSESWIILTCEVVLWILFTYCSFQFSVSSNFILISACSILSSCFWKSLSGSRFDDECEALFFYAILRSCGCRVIIKLSVIFVFSQSSVIREYAFRTKASTLTVSCFLLSRWALRISLHKTLWCYLFLSETNHFENSCVNCFQSDFISIGRSQNLFSASPSSLFEIKLCVYVSMKLCFHRFWNDI